MGGAGVQKLDPSRYGWLSDYAVALREARRSGKPIFLVFRCEPWLDCAEFDAQVVRLPKEIRDVAEQFVRVRLVQIAGMDLRRFEFDYDVT